MMFTWLLLIAATVIVGFTCFRFLSGWVAVVLAALLPWCIFLLFNLAAEYYSTDKEVMSGSWLGFQITLGSFFAVLGVVSGWLTNRDNRKHKLPRQ
jgi:purine-cytosine permease-like protein